MSRNTSKIPDAGDTDIEKPAPSMRSIDVHSCWRTETLHAIVGAAEQKCADHIDAQMDPDVQSLYCVTAAIVNLDEATLGVQCGQPYQHTEIDEKRQHRQSGSADRATFPAMQATRPCLWDDGDTGQTRQRATRIRVTFLGLLIWWRQVVTVLKQALIVFGHCVEASLRS